MRSTRRWAWLIAATVVMAEPGAVQAQSLFGGGGLGIPVEALDARARGLGGVGPGLFGATLTQSDPAGLAGVQLPMITVTMQPTWGEFDSDVSSGDLKGTRFPMLGVAYPFGTAGVFSVSYGGFLDQRWAAERPGSFLIGGETVPGTDRFESSEWRDLAGAPLLWSARSWRPVGHRCASIGRFVGRVDRSVHPDVRHGEHGCGRYRAFPRCQRGVDLWRDPHDGGRDLRPRVAGAHRRERSAGPGRSKPTPSDGTEAG